MDIKVTVKLSDLPTLGNEGMVIAITGTADNGDRVTYAGNQTGALIAADRAERGTQISGSALWQTLPARLAVGVAAAAAALVRVGRGHR